MTSPAHADIVGRATVIDGETIEIRGQRVRLLGIDAPESRQLCYIKTKSYRCGQQVALAVADRIEQKTVRCEERDIDRDDRVVAVCSPGQEDVNAWIVREGWALASRKYSLDYVDAEDEARKAKHEL